MQSREACDRRRLHTRHRHYGLEDTADVEVIAETEIVRMEQALAAIGQHGDAQGALNLFLNVGGYETWLEAELDSQIYGQIDRADHFEVVTREATRVEIVEQRLS